MSEEENEVLLSNNNLSIYGSLFDICNLNGNIDLGRMPQNDNEIVLSIRKDSYFNDKKENNYNGKFYVSREILNKLRIQINKNYSTIKVLLNNKYQQYVVEKNDNVEKGKAIVDDELKYQFKNYKILNQSLNIYINNIYYSEEINLSIKNTYTKSNLKKLTGIEDYDNNRYKIFINTEDYNSLYNKSSYQSSVYVKDEKIVDETIVKLENLGITAKKVTDFKVNQNEGHERIIKITKVVVTIILIIVLFFISYLIIQIILKSRNIYYTTLRMLGATYKDVKRILEIELFINSTISYCALLLFIYSVKINLVKIEYISKLINFLSIKEYVLMYIILIVIARLISINFARKLFKNTAINTYNEEA